MACTAFTHSITPKPEIYFTSMAFFKFRKNSTEPTREPAQPESVETMRQRAKHRLMGATVLVLLGVIGFPLLFDKQPRPIAVETPIDIPDKNKVLALTIPQQMVPQVVADRPSVAASSSESVVITEMADPIETKLDAKTAVAPVNQAFVAHKNVAVIKPDRSVVSAAAVVRPNEAALAQALLEGQTPEMMAAANTRFIVQVGLFVDPARLREVRLKVEQAGLKTYIHVADTKDGKRIRVRVGPFSVKADAENAVAKIKALDLPANLLTL